jgi:hypothetical protein
VDDGKTSVRAAATCSGLRELWIRGKNGGGEGRGMDLPVAVGRGYGWRA